MIDSNPYSPPRDGGKWRADDDRRFFVHASLGRRLLGGVVDVLFGVILWYVTRIAARHGVSFSALIGTNELGRALTTFTGAGLMYGINGALIAMRGQSFGKIIVSTRIVDAAGRQVGFVQGFVARTLLFVAIAALPGLLRAGGLSSENLAPVNGLTGLIIVVDSLMLFGAERRCLHDRVAGTYVAVA
jgi:uncharacterized RDD family membrane protein YckC